MHPPLLGICAGPEAAPAVARAGADFLEVSVQDFLVPGDDETRFAARRAAVALPSPPILAANLFLPARLPCVGPSVDAPALEAYAATAMDRAARVGIRRIVFGSGGARRVPEAFSMARAEEQFVSLLKTIAPLAERVGVMIAVEPLNTHECNFINTLEEGARMIEACGHPHVGLVADTYHMGFHQEGPGELRRFGRHLRHVHVAGHPARRFPGAEGESYAGWFEALREIGYPGGVSVECNWESLDGQGREALGNLRRDLATAGYPPDGEAS